MDDGSSMALKVLLPRLCYKMDY